MTPMLTLEQAINDLMDASMTIAEVAESESDEANRVSAQNVADDCKQIAELLRELQERRKEPEVIYCKDCKAIYCDFCLKTLKPVEKEKDYCSLAERRTNE